MDQKITESHLPGQYLDIAHLPRQYLDIALAAGQYKIYCPALAFDLPTQSVTYIYVAVRTYVHTQIYQTNIDSYVFYESYVTKFSNVYYTYVHMYCD